MSQREERENNIARVIDVALELFISDGIAATSINRIAKKQDSPPCPSTATLAAGMCLWLRSGRMH